MDGTSLDLNAYCSESGFEKGTYNVGLYAMDKYGWEGGEQISAAWTGSFTFSGQSSTFNHGDVDKNGAVNTADALMALKMAVGIIKPTNEQKNIADVDKDGKITTADALAILKYAVGIIKSF